MRRLLIVTAFTLLLTGLLSLLGARVPNRPAAGPGGCPIGLPVCG